ncbi:MAG: S9 family peptidase [Bacteroidetes bacterium]|nr:S9 family peptidase [Bacteroidota bacterium]MBU1423566.1 S9 family peptidase [Bacteroidota bacterium]MBU2636201.1 S9 family peptidase [Bacteroidota bacterium]
MSESQLNTNSNKPPVANKIAKVDTTHDDVRVDNYYWLRDKSNPEVIAYLEAENKYTGEMMKPAQALQETIYNEILRRTKLTDLSVPYKLGDYWYYARTEEGKQYQIYCRKYKSIEAEEQITLDLNKLAEGHKFLGLGAYDVSDDGNLLAYSLDTTGFRVYNLYIKNLITGELLPDNVGAITSVEWAADNKTLFYVKEDAAKRPYRLFRHVLGDKNDELIFEEKDELYRIYTYRSKDKQFVFFASASSITCEVSYLSSDKPNESFKLILPREVEHEYSVDHREGLFYIRTNKNAKNFRLVTAPVSSPTKWKELIPHRKNIKLENINLFKAYAVFTERENALITFKVLDFRTNKTKTIKFPEPVYSAFPATNPEYNTKLFRYSYQSFITPSSVFDYDMEKGISKLLKQTKVLGGYDPKQYVSERIYAKASDGKRIPVSIVYKKGIKKNGTNPLLCYGYGAYGASMPVAFSIPRLSLLDRGVVYALAHIRGGGDLGEEWYDDGKMMKKINTFTDFIACTEHLIKDKYTSHEKLAIQGGSAGGLLIGAVLNMRPDLFKVAHMAVPFVDVVNTMLDESLPLTVGEFLEWGNPKIKEEYEYIKSYCPYTNIEARAYPDILITTSLNDSQVMYWEPAKYTAKMHTLKTDNNLLLLKTNMGAGHGGASGRYDAFKEQAFIYAFILHGLGIIH